MAALLRQRLATARPRLTVMNPILAEITRQTLANPGKVALEGDTATLDYAELKRTVGQAAERLMEFPAAPVGLLLDNGPAWAVIDLAALAAHLPLAPLPGFFSSGQIEHIVRDAGIGLILSDDPARAEALAKRVDASPPLPYAEVAGMRISACVRPNPAMPARLPAGTCKITYTSGTTGEPKGVCLSLESLLAVTLSLKQRAAAGAMDRHLCLTPLSTLLENIGGLYAPLLSGATSLLPSLRDTGLIGASGLDRSKMYVALRKRRATSAILSPQMLKALVETIEAGPPVPEHLRFLAVGGAPVSKTLLRRAESLGLPVFQGYGLSECASVVAVNGPDGNRLDSVGKPLPHLQVAIAGHGEILVKGPLFLGYLGEGEIDPGAFLPTGDIGRLDEEGYLYVTARKKSLFITAFGRNVSPEWVEHELSLEPAIAQAAVYGEGRPWNSAVIVSSLAATDEGGRRIDAAVENANRRLPDYARLRRWIAADEPFTPANRQWSAAGQPRRDEIRKVYGERLDALYESQSQEERPA